jgi:hypothetical protein
MEVVGWGLGTFKKQGKTSAHYYYNTYFGQGKCKSTHARWKWNYDATT